MLHNFPQFLLLPATLGIQLPAPSTPASRTPPAPFSPGSRPPVPLHNRRKPQSPTQSPQAFWSAGGRQERLRGNGIVTAGILQLTVVSLFEFCCGKLPIKKSDFSITPESLLATTR